MDTLYEYIASAVVNGELPDDFSLPDVTEGENDIKWADGAQDGVTIYHTNIPEPDKDQHMLISDAVRAASKRDYDLADRLFKMLGKHLRAIIAIDDLQTFVIDNRDKLDANNILEYAMHLLFESDNKECVKFGLSLLELFRTDDMEILKNAIRTIGLSDEFALFAIFVMLKWTDGNNDVWELAKKVHGWGRIHAVERIEPDTEEIRKWMLMEGVHNNIMPAYSALTCWEKSNAEEVLRKGPSREEYTGIGAIIEGLLDEGPVAGISALENSDEIILDYLDAAGKMELTLDDYIVIYNIFTYYRETVSDKCEIAMICKRFLHLYHCWCLVIDAVKEGRCIDMASDIGIDVTPYVSVPAGSPDTDLSTED